MVIAILAALILPALAQAKFRAKNLNCMTNLKNWCVVVNVYAGDNAQGRLPRFDWNSNGGKRSWNLVPFISCAAGSGNVPGPPTNPQGLDLPLSGRVFHDPNGCSPNPAHFYNRVLKGVNAAYADGHVEMHNKKQMTCGYAVNNAAPYWFY